MKTIQLSDAQWGILYPLLKADPRAYVGDEGQCRQFVDAVLWITRAGAPWRLLPEAYGSWNTIYKRYARWCEAGVWDRVLATVSQDADLENVMLDSTIVKAHACATGAAKKAGAPKVRGSAGDATG
jgi:transposase